MKEGLRSGKLYAKVENSSKVSLDQVVVEWKGDEVNRVGSDSVSEKVTNLVLCSPEPERESLGLKFEKSDELSCGVFEESGGTGGVDDDEGRCEKVEEVVDNGRKRKRVEGGEDIGNGGVGRKKIKEEQLSDELQVGRRVLRSSSALTSGCDKVKVEDGLDQKCSEGDTSEKKWVEEKNVVSDQLVSALGKQSEPRCGRPPLVKNVESDASGLKKLKGKRGRPRKAEKEEHGQLASDGSLTKKLKDKRGRPRKFQESNKPLKLKRGRPRKLQESPVVLKLKRGRPRKTEERNGILKLKLGRPRKVEKQENSTSVSDGRLKKLKRKRGRPRKLQESNEVLRGDCDKEREVVVDDKRQLEHSIARPSQQDPNLQAFLSCQEMMQNGKELNVKRFSLAKRNEIGVDLETKETEASSGKRPKKGSIKDRKIKKKIGELEPARSMVKQSVREKIIELLLSAGWTIQHRPRAGRDYADSVYVSLEGRTHWSVTLAYKMLKKHYEDGDGDSKVYKTGFKFIPIPDEEISILTKVIVKKREGKKKLKPMEGRVIDKTKCKKKLFGKSPKGRLKGKSLPHEKKNSAGTQHKGMPILVRDHNRLKTQNGKRRTLLVRNSMEDADSDSDGYILYAGKRTVLAWMIDLETVSLNGKVHYKNRRKTRVLLEGRITRDGILCDCCSETFTISKFETHAGSKLCEPFNNICIESGTSLLQCLLDSWNKQQESECKGFHYVDVNGEDPNDDTCGICGDGGQLICCDGCPSTFHQSCLDIQNFPSGDWRCVYCSCKFCGMAGGRECQGTDNDDLAASELLTCQLCEEKFHRFCSRSKDAGYDHSRSSSFCGKKCQQLFKKLKTLLGVKHDLEEGFSWTLVHRSDVGAITSVCDIPQECNVAQKVECNSKLAVALSIMDECFLPMVDHRSGINLIHNIVYNFGSNFNRLNYSGFYTAILERGDEIVCAASIRIHGDQLAEMPFIGTRYMYRRQGMCRRLLCAIESGLASLDVERLVIPAISELTGTWTSVFGFRPLDVSHKQKMKNINMVVFPGVQMLQKPLLKTENAAENLIVVEGPRSSELEHQTEEVLCKTVETCTKGCLSKISSEANTANGVNINESTLESSLQLPDVSLNITDTNRKCLVEFCMAHDNLEGDKSIEKSSGSTCGQTEEIIDYQNAVCGLNTSVLDQKGVELGRQSNHCGISEEESKSLVLPSTLSEATEAGGSVLCASREDTESADCEVRVEDRAVTDNLNSHDEGYCSAGINTSEPQEKTRSPELEVSVEKIVRCDSSTRVEISNGKCQHPEHYPEEKTIGSHEMENDLAAALQTSFTLDENFSTSLVCSVSQSLDTSKVSVDTIDPILNQEAEDDFKDSGMPLPVNSSYSNLQSNGLRTHDVLVSPPVDSNCDPSCMAYVDSNGLCKSKEVISSSLGVMVDGIQD